jgi:membrane associated rhomboid family serine protease
MGGEQMIFIPLSDDNPLRHIPYQWVTVGLIGANVVVFAWQYVGIGPTPAASFALVPSELFQAGLLGGSAYGRYDTIAIPEGYTLLTYMFFHADILHLSTNMLFLWVFGDNVEDAMGHLRFVVFFTACGVVAGVLYAVLASDTARPLVGASGAVSGVMGAYLVLHPRVKIWGLFLNRVPLKLRAFWGIGFWVAFQIGAALIGADVSTGWYAHVGGFAAGALLVVPLRRRGQALFGRDDDAQLTGDA